MIRAKFMGKCLRLSIAVTVLAVAGCSKQEPAAQPEPLASKSAVPKTAPVADDETLRPGDIRLDGEVRSVNSQQDKAVLAVTSFSLPNGRKRKLSRAKTKYITISSSTKINSSSSQVDLLPSVLQPGAIIGVIGQDTGSGKGLSARFIKVKRDAPLSVVSGRVASGSPRTSADYPVTSNTRQTAPSAGSPRQDLSHVTSLSAFVEEDVEKLAVELESASTVAELNALEAYVSNLQSSYANNGAGDAVFALDALKTAVRQKRSGPNGAGLSLWRQSLSRARKMARRASQNARMTPEQKEQESEKFIQRMKDYENAPTDRASSRKRN